MRWAALLPALHVRTVIHVAAHPGTSSQMASPEFLALAQLAEGWQVLETTIYRLMASGELAKAKIGTEVIRFARADVEQIELRDRVTGPQRETTA